MGAMAVVEWEAFPMAERLAELAAQGARTKGGEKVIGEPTVIREFRLA